MEKSKTFVRDTERAFGVQVAEEVTEETIETKVEAMTIKEEVSDPQVAADEVVASDESDSESVAADDASAATDSDADEEPSA